jgi:L-threonylcarbamoyladenylate synthase
MLINTRINKISSDLISEGDVYKLLNETAILEGACLLKKGEVVAFPTETVYGLGADATNTSAVRKIFEAKGRPQDNPLIVHISNLEQLYNIIDGEVPENGKKLINAFWPGPLTLILSKSREIPDITTAGLDSIAVRMPEHPVARALIEKSSLPLAAPSANSSGYPSPTLAEHVIHDLKGKIPYIIDGGACKVGVESTVVDVRGENVKILRPGGVTREDIELILGYKISSSIDLINLEKPITPGMKYRHYSPETPLYIIDREKLFNIKTISAGFNKEKIALILTNESKENLKDYSFIDIYNMGSLYNMEEIAHNLFAILRELDRKSYDIIFIERIPEKGIGEAVMNRLHKASIKGI